MSNKKRRLRVVDGNWQRLSIPAGWVRDIVFIQEQGVPREYELDGQDPNCHHVVVYSEDDDPIGTARLFPDGHVGRVAVVKSERGTGVGTLVMESVIDVARSKGLAKIVLESQVHAKDFYLRLGFKMNESRGEFIVADIPHIEMHLDLISDM